MLSSTLPRDPSPRLELPQNRWWSQEPSHQHRPCRRAIKFRGRRRREGSRFRPSSAVVQVVGGGSGKPSGVAAPPRWGASPPRRRVASARGGRARNPPEITDSFTPNHQVPCSACSPGWLLAFIAGMISLAIYFLSECKLHRIFYELKFLHAM